MQDVREPPPERLSVAVEERDDEVVLRLGGELDLASVDELERRLAGVLAAAPARIVVDLGPLAFIDSSGLRAIIQGDAAARATDVELVLWPGDDSIQRVFELTGVLAALRFEDAPPA
jgi:anti-anti-sigma factor